MNKEEKNSNKCPICGRPTHKESKYCIFHANAEEKTEEEFKKALKEYIKEIKKEDKDYDFEKFIFIGDIDFERDFKVTTFKNANFAYSTLSGSIFFLNSAFKGITVFSNVTFEGEIKFWSITFETKADFRRVVFKKNAEFDGITFKGLTDFRHVIFERNADFERVRFKEDAKFDDATFQGNLSFKYANLSPIKKLNLRVKKKGILSFEYASLENVYLNLDLDKGVLIDFINSLLRNTKIERDQIENHILQEEKKKFSEAQKIYLLLKNNFHSIGKYEDESWAFKKEKDMERLSQSFPYYKTTLKNENKKESLPILKWIQKGNFKKWITSAFSNMIYGYGEKPWNVIKTAVAIILIFALFFSFTGLGNPEIIELKGTAIHNNSGNIIDLTSKGFLKNNVIRNFPDSLYFSTITFTTLGYGDFRPLEGLGRILAGSEAFLGAIMMALFVYTFARRTGGR